MECLERFRSAYPEYEYVTLSYAGRLDPMAEGVLLVLEGEEENRQREQYLRLPKEYQFTVLLGFETDTYDVLGKISNYSYRSLDIPTMRDSIVEYVRKLPGRFMQPYPPYSSRTVAGEPLFMLARSQSIDGVAVPEREVEIYQSELLSLEQVPASSLRQYIIKNISKIKGDFRQGEIFSIWSRMFETNPDTEYLTASIHIACGSGVYVRSIAHVLGKHLNFPTLALHIIRTRVGDHSIEHSLRYSI